MRASHLRIVNPSPVRAARPSSGREHTFVRILVAALLLISLGVVIGKVFRAVSVRAYRPEVFELNLNVAQAPFHSVPTDIVYA